MASITRRQFARLAGTGALSLSLGGVLAGCAGGAGSSAGAGASSGGAAGSAADGVRSSQVIVSMTPGSEPAAGFDPLVSWGCGEHVHEPLIQSTLIRTDADLNFQNDLATSYECSEDGLTWTFSIRDDVRFTDGQPLTARDVAFTINGIVSAAASECDLSMVREARGRRRRHGGHPHEKAVQRASVHAGRGGHRARARLRRGLRPNPVGSGRYLLEQWDKGQQVILRANPDYYGEAPKMERVVVVFMEEDASLAAAQSGQVDVAYTAATYAANQPAGYDLAELRVGGLARHLPSVRPRRRLQNEKGDAVPAGNDVTCDLAVRQAINYGVDRERMIDNVLNGYGTVAYSVGDGMPWSSPDMRATPTRSKAKQLLDDAGWAAGRGRRPREGRRARLARSVLLGWRLRAPGHRRRVRQPDGRAGHRGDVKGRELGRSLSAPVQRSGGVGLGHQRPRGDVQPVLLARLGQLRLLRERLDRRLSRRGAGTPQVEDSFELWKKAQWDGATGFAPQGDAPWVWLSPTSIHLLLRRREGLRGGRAERRIPAHSPLG